ncbi:MAG TPA: sugar phosphate isomerase/epimerase family protein [Armatimonadota bacterium]|jgi:sugar phosphate isomerase/epimerase
MPFEIALCSKLLQDHPLVEAIEIAGRLGYAGMEIFGVPSHLPLDADDARVAEAARALDKAGMECVTLATYLGGFAEKSDAECERELEGLERYMDIAEELECDMIRVMPGGPLDVRDAREDHWGRAVHYLTECCDRALGRGVGIIVENNQGLSRTLDSTLELLNLVDRPNLGVNYDPGNLYRFGKYYAVEALERFGEQVWNVQIKDADKSTGEDRWQMLLGEGQVDYATIIQWLVDEEYEGFLSVESHRLPDDKLTDVDICRHEIEAVRKLLKQAQG